MTKRPNRSFVAFEKRRGRAPDRLDQAYRRKHGRWPTEEQHAYRVKFDKWPTPSDIREWRVALEKKRLAAERRKQKAIEKAEQQKRDERARAARDKTQRVTKESVAKLAKKPQPRHVANYIKKHGRRPSALVIRYYERHRKWPTKEQLTAFRRRSEASRRAAETKRKERFLSGDAKKQRTIRKFEKERTQRHRKNLRDVKNDPKGLKRVPYGAYRVIKYADEFRFDVSELSTPQIYALIDLFKKSGVKAMRYLRDTPVLTEAEIKKHKQEMSWRAYAGDRTASGRVSSRWFNLQSVNREQVADGWGTIPGVEQMLDPGIDYLQFIVIKQADTRALPKRLRDVLHGEPELTTEQLIKRETSQYRLRDGTIVTGLLVHDNEEDDAEE